MLAEKASEKKQILQNDTAHLFCCELVLKRSIISDFRANDCQMISKRPILPKQCIKVIEWTNLSIEFA